jgi:Subtilase family/Tetratricopeptide repeat
MMWRDDDVVEVFGAKPASGSFMDYVRDPTTGAYFRLSSPKDEESDKLFHELLNKVYPRGAPEVRTVMAILDTGILHDHPLLRGRVIAEVDFTSEGTEDLSGHGTAMALIAVRDTDQFSGLINIKVVDGSNRGNPANLIKGLNWLAEYKSAHPDEKIFANISAGVYRRRLLGTLPCDGSCDVCSAAYRVSSAGILVTAAAGNSPGKTACPATLALRTPDSNVTAITVVGPHSNFGIGTLAGSEDSQPRPYPIPVPQPDVASLTGDEADVYALRLAEQLDEQNDDTQAEKIYQHLRRYGGPKAQSVANLALGLRAAAKGQLAQAKEMLQESIRSENADQSLRPQTLYALGHVADAQGQWDEATHYLQEAMNTGNERYAPLAAQILGNKLVNDGNLEAAIPYLETAMTSDKPEVALQAQYNMAIARRRLGQRDAAYAAYKAAASEPSPVQAKAQLGLASMLADEGSNEEALDWLRLASSSADAGVRARALLALGDFGAALGNAQIARHYYTLAINSADPEISALARNRMAGLH